MGVEKNLNNPRLDKMTSVDIYRPPPLRNHSTETHRTDGSTAVKELAVIATTIPIVSNTSVSKSTTSSSAIDTTATTTSISCSNSPIHSNDNAVADPKCAQQQRQAHQTARRERRPDRAVYIPRARRSQTTPPNTISMTTTAAATAAATATATGAISCRSSNNSNNHQLAIAQSDTKVDSVSSAPPFKTDEVGRGNTAKKPKNTTTNTTTQREPRERKEFTSKKSSQQALNISDAENIESIAAANETPTLLVVAQKQNVNAKERIFDSKIMKSIDCDKTEPLEEVGIETSLNEQMTPSQGDTTTKMETNIEIEPKTRIESRNKSSKRNKQSKACDNNNINLANSSNLLIEDVASRVKCDIDAQELLRASKKINRSNRRIIKQTFVSDVLEIPDSDEVSIVKLTSTSTATATSEPTETPITVTSEQSKVDGSAKEDEEGDWESMYDESGECLDPKIMEELTASVGKVKIELPKMDYSAYLTKQSILNEEEFPHVLEVSNFPVEFKNQDLLMVFSQYKESGFDIKWVDDTHALAVFSSSRIAAEVLTMGHPFVVLKPLAEATVESRLKAKKCAASLQPYRPRPETCAALARRLVTGALGVRLETAAAERENEKRVLREAKERKLLAAKQRDDAWES